MRGSTQLSLGILLVLAALGPSLAGGHGGWRTWIVNAHDAEADNGTVAWYTVDDGREPNPTLDVHQGERIVLHLVNLGERDHTLVLGAPIDQTVGPVSPGNESSVSFEIPPNATGTIGYYDPDWQHRGMRGEFAINGTTEEQDEAPGLSGPVIVGLLVIAAVASRRPTED